MQSHEPPAWSVYLLIFIIGLCWTLWWIHLMQEGVVYLGRKWPYYGQGLWHEIYKSDSAFIFWCVLIFWYIIPASLCLGIPMFLLATEYLLPR